MPYIDVNGQTIDYPDTGDTNWGDNATNFAIQTSAALGKIGLSSGTSVDIPGTLDVTGNTTLDANLSVAGIVNVDSGVLYVDPTNNRVGINDTTPSEALDVTGNAIITGNLAVDTNTLYVDSTNNRVGIVNSSPSKALDVTGEIQSSSHITCNGVVYADDDTTANTPVISFIGDTNTGIGRSAADTLDFITNGNSRFRIESTGQIKAVYESQVGTDYNTQLDNGYFCRAWVNFNGTGTIAIKSSGNVSSITDLGNGQYRVNFATSLPDTNYAILLGNQRNATSLSYGFFGSSNSLVGSVELITVDTTSVNTDYATVCVGIFR